MEFSGEALIDRLILERYKKNHAKEKQNSVLDTKSGTHLERPDNIVPGLAPHSEESTKKKKKPTGASGTPSFKSTDLKKVKQTKAKPIDIRDLNNNPVKYIVKNGEKIDILDFPGIYLFVGKPKRGKSVMMTNILKAELGKRFKFGKVFSGTAGMNNDFNFLPKDYISPFTEDALLNHIGMLEKLTRKLGDNMPENFIVLDDVVGDLNSYVKKIKQLFSRHRHMKCTVFLCTQHLADQASGTILRSCVTHGFFFYDRRFDALEAIWKNFGQEYDKFKEFKKFFLEVTKEDHRALLYRQDGKTIEDTYYMAKIKM